MVRFVFITVHDHWSESRSKSMTGTNFFSIACVSASADWESHVHTWPEKSTCMCTQEEETQRENTVNVWLFPEGSIWPDVSSGGRKKKLNTISVCAVLIFCEIKCSLNMKDPYILLLFWLIWHPEWYAEKKKTLGTSALQLLSMDLGWLLNCVLS